MLISPSATSSVPYFAAASLAPERIARAMERMGASNHADALANKEWVSGVQQAFARGEAIVWWGQPAIIWRILSSYITDKHRDAPVVAIVPDAAAETVGWRVVVLLGAHRGGDDLARRVVEAIDAVQADDALTAAVLGAATIPFDAPPPGWAAVADAKSLMAAARNAQPLVSVDSVWGTVASNVGVWAWLTESGHAAGALTAEAESPAQIWVSPFVPQSLGAQTYHLVPRSVVIGVGCARHCASSTLAALVEESIADAGLDRRAVAAIATIDLKADETAVLDLAEAWGVPLFFAGATALAAIEVPNPSQVVADEVGTPSVAEAAALLLASEYARGARLIAEKTTTDMATCALAMAGQPLHFAEPVSAAAACVRRGEIAVVGIGPSGGQARLTPEAFQALAGADALVGYELYLSWLPNSLRHRDMHAFGLGEEAARCRHALGLARAGKRVALVCSGDGGIYAMGSLLLEECARVAEGKNAEIERRITQGIAITMVPGITAMQAASSAAGAILGHDFCAISLSTLMTPRAVIWRRVCAAAEADFVMAFYNPRSRGRPDFLAEVLAEIARHRPAETPVVLGRALGSAEQEVTIVPLHAVDPERVDMHTTVIVGNRQSRMHMMGNQVLCYTPRGYHGFGE